jgi:hypothetical protein
MATSYDDFVKAVELATGEKLEVLQRTAPDERRRALEAKHGRPMQFRSWFPFIGRGNALRDCTLSHSEVEAALTEALR